MENLSLKELNKKIPDCKFLYDILVDNKGYYLPKFSSKSCTLSYLMKIVKDPTVFKPFRAKISKPPYVKQRKTVEDLLNIVEELLKKDKLTLGLDPDTRPDKEWLIDVLHMINPKHPIFLYEDHALEREFPKG